MTTHAMLELANADFIALPDLISIRAAEQPEKAAFVDDSRSISFATLNSRMTKVAYALQREGARKGDAVAICCARNSIEYVEAFFGALRAGAVVAPLAPSSTPEALVAQLDDSGARILFLDGPVADHLEGLLHHVKAKRVSLDESGSGGDYAGWTSISRDPVLPALQTNDAFNLIYPQARPERRKGSYSRTGCGGLICGDPSTPPVR